MPKKETTLSFLAQFIPDGSFEMVEPYFRSHVIHFTITRERKTVLGDYRHPVTGKPHRISVNGSLNKFSFLITLLHELAHLLTFNQFGNRVSPHGDEWKGIYRQVLIPFLGKSFFPPDVEKALIAYLRDPAASTCGDPRLFKALAKYDEKSEDMVMVDELVDNQFFATEDGNIYQKIEKRRTRTKCRHVKTGRMYLFPGIAMVIVCDPKDLRS